jgi:hypothetical protein
MQTITRHPPSNHGKATKRSQRAKDLGDALAPQDEAKDGARECESAAKDETRGNLVAPEAEGDGRVRAESEEGKTVVYQVAGSRHPARVALLRQLGEARAKGVRAERAKRDAGGGCVSAREQANTLTESRTGAEEGLSRHCERVRGVCVQVVYVKRRERC